MKKKEPFISIKTLWISTMAVGGLYIVYNLFSLFIVFLQKKILSIPEAVFNDSMPADSFSIFEVFWNQAETFYPWAAIIGLCSLLFGLVIKKVYKYATYVHGILTIACVVLAIFYIHSINQNLLPVIMGQFGEFQEMEMDGFFNFVTSFQKVILYLSGSLYIFPFLGLTILSVLVVGKEKKMSRKEEISIS